MVCSQAFEVVYVSADKTQQEFDKSFGSMPWLAMPYEEREKKSLLDDMLEQRGIPNLILVDAEGKVITMNGPSFAYSLPVHSFHTRRDRVASLRTCRLHGAAIQRTSPLGPGRALTLPCGWNNAGRGACPRPRSCTTSRAASARRPTPGPPR